MVFEASPVVIDLPETTFNLSMGMSFQASPIITDLSVPDQVDVNTIRVARDTTRGTDRYYIVITWDAPYDGGSSIDSYNVDWGRYGVYTTSTPSHDAFTLIRTVRLRWRVRAHNAVGWGQYSDWTPYITYNDISDTSTATTPAQVTGLSASATNENSINTCLLYTSPSPRDS